MEKIIDNIIEMEKSQSSSLIDEDKRREELSKGDTIELLAYHRSLIS